jgi:superkiller protein 3
MVLTDLGDYAGAAEALKKVTKVEPDWVFALNELGIAYRKQEKYGDAIEQFKLAIKRDDKYAIAYYNLAEAEFRNGNLGNAKKAYQSLLKLKRRDLAGQLELLTNGAIAQK